MRLSESDYFDFIEAHHRILLFTGNKLGLFKKNKSPKEFQRLSLRNKAKCREKLNNDETILDEYILFRGTDIKKNEIDLVNGLRKKITEKFIILKLLRKHSIFIGRKKVYGVLALANPFYEMIDEFPAYVKATILPFRNKIVYDGFIEPYSIRFGKNIRESLNREYLEAKKNGTIVSTL